MEKQNLEKRRDPVIEKILALHFTRTNYLLAPHTYYNIGGPAEIAMLPESEADLIQAYQLFSLLDYPKLLIGGGTNLLISDRGFHGVVLFLPRLNDVSLMDKDTYYVFAGTELSWLVENILLPNNYEGVGALTGIPGTVGGALYMNAGTANGSICEFVKYVLLLTPGMKKVVSLDPSLYSYRSQEFCKLNELIAGAIFKFERSKEDQRAIYEHYTQRRREKQPQGYCCGSVFKNPPGYHAGKLIEECGLKGKRCGGAVISKKHANFIMNEGNATFKDVLCLIKLAKSEVYKRFNIELEEEVLIIFEDGCIRKCEHLDEETYEV
ncbi:MAG: UDP-N-acetylmuramate dehydrogenase [Candidatus Hydrogenedentes bacterium]|nr:UDP-N-acetylmuramate dehydrogenase [Candidatus Hydrogenedentota bacterium]